MRRMAVIAVKKTVQRVSVKFTIVILWQAISLILMTFYLWHVYCVLISITNIGVTHGYGSVHYRNLSAGLFTAIISVIYAWRRADNN
jgi:hypothetical protein